jgi:hypothetical protein
MDTIALLIFYYVAIAAFFNWALAKQSALFTAFIAIVVSQTMLFGAQVIYDGYWDSWNDIALIMSTALCILTTAIVTIVFIKHRSKGVSAPT